MDDIPITAIGAFCGFGCETGVELFEFAFIPIYLRHRFRVPAMTGKVA
jgi:hypothetical protein